MLFEDLLLALVGVTLLTQVALPPFLKLPFFFIFRPTFWAGKTPGAKNRKCIAEAEHDLESAKAEQEALLALERAARTR